MSLNYLSQVYDLLDTPDVDGEKMAALLHSVGSNDAIITVTSIPYESQRIQVSYAIL
ncbi:hypothetical protein LHK12_19765 [Providencia rettgeri]|nr:hypothetical protein [Providencia rettgeri]